jgi:glucose/arabinose dehydrogenase
MDKNGVVDEDFEIRVDGVRESGEGGLLGMAVDPKFSSNKFIYVYFTYSSNGVNTLNKVVGFKLDQNKLSDEKILVDKIPGASNHNGGRLKFGPDGLLYITTGDSESPSLSQDKNSMAGKILRVDGNGKVEVYSYGHRNPQGLDWDASGQLYSTEHGASMHDEVNLIKQGNNYGWPTIQGAQAQSGMTSPFLEGGDDTWAPSGATFHKDRFFFAGLKGTGLFEFDPSDNSLTKHFDGEFGRIRDVVLGPDNLLYILTSNTDGRGDPSPQDDRIIRINPESLQ